ncbi:MAG: glycosyltransferase family 4 protein [Dehalococcoidia bacterium]
MRICFLQAQGQMYSGGLGVYLHYITRELAALGHEVEVIAGPPYPDVAPGVRLHRLKTYSYWGRLAAMIWGYEEYADRHPFELFHPLNFFEFATSRFTVSSLLNVYSLRALELLNELERQRPFDLVHDNQTLAYGVWLMRARGRPVVATVHHPRELNQQTDLAELRSALRRVSSIVQYPWLMQRFVAPRLDCIVTDSNASAQAIERTYGVARDRIRVVYIGVDADVFRRLDIRREPNSLLFVGNPDDSNKGVRYLLEALRLLKHELPVHLTIVQRPGSLEARRLVQRLGLFGRVTFRESLTVPELVREYNRVELLVSPSLYEGFGLPAAEAMACETPVLATTGGALPEVVSHGETGWLVPPGDARALAEAIRKLRNNVGLRERLGRAGRQSVLERFSWRRAAHETADAYWDVLGRSREQAAFSQAVR